MANGKTTWKYNKLLTARKNYFDGGGPVETGRITSVPTNIGEIVRNLEAINRFDLFKTYDVSLKLNTQAAPFIKKIDSMKVKPVQPKSPIFNAQNIGNYAAFASAIMGNVGNMISDIEAKDVSANVDDQIALANANIVKGPVGSDSYDQLTNDMNSYIPTSAATENSLGRKSAGSIAGGALAGATSGAAAGAALGPWGAAAGAIIGAGTSLIGSFGKNAKIKKETARLNLAREEVDAFNKRQFSNRAENIATNQLQNLEANYAAFGGPLDYSISGNDIFAQNAKNPYYSFGGELSTQGSNFTNGLLYIDNGGSHETNPYEGVPIGVDPEGIPNLVEEGETIFKDYVFSKRLVVPKEFKKKFKLKEEGRLSFADASKKLAKESEERPNDPISNRGLLTMLDALALTQEEVRQKMEVLEMNNDDNMSMLIPEMMNYDMEQQLMSEEDLMAPGMHAFGGNIFDKGSLSTNITRPANSIRMAGAESVTRDFINNYLRKNMPYFAYGLRMDLEDPYLGMYDTKTGILNLDKYGDIYGDYFLTKPDTEELLNRYQVFTKLFNLEVDPSIKKTLIGIINRYNKELDPTGKKYKQLKSDAKYEDVSKVFNSFSDLEKYMLISLPEFKDTLLTKNNYLRIVDENGELTKDTIPDNIKFPEDLTKYKDWEKKTGYKIVNIDNPDIEDNSYGPKNTTLKILKNIPNNSKKDSKVYYLNGNKSNYEEIELEMAKNNELSLLQTLSGDNKTSYYYGIKDDKQPTTLNPYLRYAPIIGSGLMSISDAFGLTNNPDYTEANSLRDAALMAGQYTPVAFNPIGNYMAYKPFDKDLAINKLNAEAGASRRALLNTSGGNRATATANILAADNNYLNQLGELTRKSEEYNLAQRKQVDEFNRATNQTNSAGFLQAATANQKALQEARNAYFKGIGTAEELRYKERQANELARSNNLSNFINSIGDYGREQTGINTIRTDSSLLYTRDGLGKMTYKKAKGGLLTIKRK